MEESDYPDGYYDVSESMLEQEEIQKKIESYEKVDEDIKNGIVPF